MYSPTDQVFSSFRKLIKRPEGFLFLLLAFCYVLAFAFFSEVVHFAKQYGVLVDEGYRVAFLLMPLALLAAFLQMDISAKNLSDRVLTAVVLVIVSVVPVFHIFR